MVVTHVRPWTRFCFRRLFTPAVFAILLFWAGDVVLMHVLNFVAKRLMSVGHLDALEGFCWQFD